MSVAIGIDLGATKVAGALVNDQGQTLAEARLSQSTIGWTSLGESDAISGSVTITKALIPAVGRRALRELRESPPA